MREIKFRAVVIDDDGDKGLRYDVWPHGDSVFVVHGGFWMNYERIEQYTGLKDKEGREIYEGDIVKSKPYVFTGKYINGRVFWHDVRAQWRVVAIEWDDEFENLTELLRPEHETEVIGNIYENPELLKDTASGGGMV